MSTLDVLIALPILWGMFQGFRRGFVVEISTLAALVLGVYGALAFGAYGGGRLMEWFNTDPQLSNILGFALVFILIVIGVHLLGRALQKVLQLVALGLFNRLMGLLFGGAKWALVVGCLIYAIDGVAMLGAFIGEDRLASSVLYQTGRRIIPEIYSFVVEHPVMN